MDTDGRLHILEVEIGQNFVILISYNGYPYFKIRSVGKVRNSRKFSL